MASRRRRRRSAFPSWAGCPRRRRSSARSSPSGRRRRLADQAADRVLERLGPPPEQAAIASLIADRTVLKGRRGDEPDRHVDRRDGTKISHAASEAGERDARRVSQLPSIAQVTGPTMPSDSRKKSVWKVLTASSVFRPNLPSTGPGS